MQYYIGLALSLILASTKPIIEKNMDTSPLKIMVNCRDNPSCLFDNNDIVIDLTITNNTDHEIGLPLEYLRKKGLHCFLVDNETNRKITMGISLTPESIRREFVKVGSGESIKVSRKISAELILSIRDKMVDLTANLAVAGLLQLHEGEEPVNFVEEVKVAIQGRDKFDLDNEK
jgi:hypothetical protein